VEHDLSALKADFPILERRINGKRLVYLDSAASSQKPVQVLDAMDRFHRCSYANVHRGVYQIATEATEAMEAGRAAVARFLGAADADEVVFTRNATEGVNLVAHSWGRTNLQAGDVVVLSHMEHHANIVPWHMLAAERGIELRWIPLTADGRLDTTHLDQLLDGAKLLAVSAMSNVLGTVNDVTALAAAAHAAGALVLLDGAQAVPHVPTDVQAIGADFLVCSAHKLCGPSGVGALWGRKELLDAMPPFLGGGEMILDVRLDGFTPNVTPHKFEAGTPAIADIVGFGAAVEYLSAVGMDVVRAHEIELVGYAIDRLEERIGDRIKIHGPRDPAARGGVVSFELDDVHPHDVSQILDQEGVCVRAGHHCAKPLMRLLGIGASARASFYVYNDEADADALVDALAIALKYFAL
jgi:cysteine desulfurase / selenocysteine lyase